MRKITVYGADWCPLTRRALVYLERLGVPFEYVDVEANPDASEWVKSQNNGKEKKPTIDINGKILSEPTNEELKAALA
ncbi:MAG: thioredoxin reductase [Bryobacterales bacterium]|jgi:glutaredoxin|nr:thioredoxin reductase [Bryobacterales bacterium]